MVWRKATYFCRGSRRKTVYTRNRTKYKKGYQMSTDIARYKELDIVPYGSHLTAIVTPSNAQRLRVFRMFGMRSIITPMHWCKAENFNRNLALSLTGYAIDNGAFLCEKYNLPFPTEDFIALCKEWGHGADWIAIPDVFGDGPETLKQLPKWIKTIRSVSPESRLLLVWQDGMTLEHIKPFLADGIGVFVGGTTEGKLSNMAWISKACNDFGVWCHIGRVNTKKRVRLCKEVKAHSFDGSGWSMFICTLRHILMIMHEDRRNLSSLLYTKNLTDNMLDYWLKNRPTRQKILTITTKQMEDYQWLK